MRKSLILFTLQYNHHKLPYYVWWGIYIYACLQSTVSQSYERDYRLCKSRPQKSKQWKGAKYRTLERGTLEDGEHCWGHLQIVEKVKSKTGKEITEQRNKL